MLKRLVKLTRSVGAILRAPRLGGSDLTILPERLRGAEFARSWKNGATAGTASETASPSNPLLEYFNGVEKGPGIWKWIHYFEIYHRHLAKFIGRSVTVVEVGIYSGGSLPMWLHYFGAGCRVHGVDIQPECRVYENDHVSIHIGDQADRSFWKRFRDQVPSVDVFIDDGGHQPEQQIVTMEEVLPQMNPGGVFICEDVQGRRNPFAGYALSFAEDLNAFQYDSRPGELGASTTPLQAAIHSVHVYPYVVVIEKRGALLGKLPSVKHGTEWQPFKM
jgi:hypothetical protein